MAEKNGYTYYLMEAFDQIWKGKDLEGEAGAYWGVYNAKRVKPSLNSPSPWSTSPSGGSLAAISIGLAMVLLLLLFRDSRHAARPRAAAFSP